MTALLSGKTAIITGANRGIGRAIADTFATQGARIIACVRDPASCADTGWTVIPLDLADDASIKNAVKAIRAATDSIDILVNNAGRASGGLFQMAPLAEMRATFEVNLFGPIALTQALSRVMARKKAGSIINIASSTAHAADPGTLAYGSSKAALVRATQSMAAELGPYFIRVNALSPGPTRTEMLDLMEAKAADALIQSSALKRPADPADIANAALFLASDLSTHITGQVLRVDGGMA